MSFKTHLVGIAALACTALPFSSVVVWAGELLAYDEPVVPPGQDELISTMLGRGAALPDGCKFAGGVSDGPLITGTYTCPTGKVVLHVVHPDNATESAVETDLFAIMVESGAPPTNLTDALASLFRNGEGDFEWLWLTEEEDIE